MPAAAASAFQLTAARRRLVHHNRLHPSQVDFNSQPREGGWGAVLSVCLCHAKFQLTAARRRLDAVHMLHNLQSLISTHSRAKAAGIPILQRDGGQAISTHSRAKAAGQVKQHAAVFTAYFNSQPREGGWSKGFSECFRALISTHSRAKAAGPNKSGALLGNLPFQLTAARRRLAEHIMSRRRGLPFQLTAARRRLGLLLTIFSAHKTFQLTAARRRLAHRHSR